MEKINLKNGFIRFWVVLSVVWGLLVLGVASKEGLPQDDVIEGVLFFIFLWLFPLILLLGIGYVIRWVIRGFRT